MASETPVMAKNATTEALRRQARELILSLCGSAVNCENCIDRVVTLLSAQEAEIERLTAAAKKQNRELTDAHYMTAALVSFLGPSALKVWNRWQSNGVRRVHHDWGPDAAKMTGEERAAFIFDVEDSIEEPDAALTPLPEGGR